jgi:hypothetical protein
MEVLALVIDSSFMCYAGACTCPIKRGIEESFVSGFRVVILIAAALSLMSALFAWLLLTVA